MNDRNYTLIKGDRDFLKGRVVVFTDFSKDQELIGSLNLDPITSAPIFNGSVNESDLRIGLDEEEAEMLEIFRGNVFEKRNYFFYTDVVDLSELNGIRQDLISVDVKGMPYADVVFDSFKKALKNYMEDYYVQLNSGNAVEDFNKGRLYASTWKMLEEFRQGVILGDEDRQKQAYGRLRRFFRDFEFDEELGYLLGQVKKAPKNLGIIDSLLELSLEMRKEGPKKVEGLKKKLELLVQ